MKKYSVTFVQPDGRRSQPFYFFNRYDRETVAQTWQVLRSEFDQMLLDNAREKGAEVREETTVNRLLMEGERVVGVEATDKIRTHAMKCARRSRSTARARKPSPPTSAAGGCMIRI